MPGGNGDDDWRERMRRLEESVERNWADHDRIWANQNILDRNLQGMHSHLVEQKKNIDNLVAAIRELLDRIPPEKLR